MKVGQLVMLLHDTSPKHLVLTTYPGYIKELGCMFNFPSLKTFELRIDHIDKTDVLTVLVR